MLSESLRVLLTGTALTAEVRNLSVVLNTFRVPKCCWTAPLTAKPEFSVDKADGTLDVPVGADDLQTRHGNLMTHYKVLNMHLQMDNLVYS